MAKFARQFILVLACWWCSLTPSVAHIGRLITNPSGDTPINGAQVIANNVWVSTSRAVLQIQLTSTDEKIIRHDKIQGSKILPTYQEGKLWLAGAEHVFVSDGQSDPKQVNQTPSSQPIQALQILNGVPWILTSENEQVYLIKEGKLEHIEIFHPTFKAPERILAIRVLAGDVWATSSTCAYKLQTNKVENFCHVGNSPTVLEADGIVFIAGSKGLFRVTKEGAVPVKFRTKNLQSIDLPVRLLHSDEQYVYAIRAGSSLYAIGKDGNPLNILEEMQTELESSDGLWVLAKDKVYHIERGQKEGYDLPAIPMETMKPKGRFWNISILRTRRMTLLSTSTALFKLSDGKATKIASLISGRLLGAKEFGDKMWCISFSGISAIADVNSLLNGDKPSQSPRSFMHATIFNDKRRNFGFIEANDRLLFASVNGLFKIYPDIDLVTRAMEEGGWPFFFHYILNDDSARPEIAYSDRPKSFSPPQYAVFSLEKSDRDYRIGRRALAHGTEANTIVNPWRFNTIYYYVEDRNGNYSIGELERFVVGNAQILSFKGVTLTGFLALVIFGTSMVLAPVSALCNRIVTTSWGKPLEQFNFFHIVVRLVPRVQRHILKRYLNNLLNDDLIRDVQKHFKLPHTDLIADKMLAESLQQHVLLIKGPSGIGKTTYLKYLTCKAAEKAQVGISPNLVPVFISLGRIEKEGLEGAVTDQLMTHEIRFDVSINLSMFKNGGFLFLLDGLNELDGDRRNGVSNFITRYGRKNVFILTSQLDEPNLPTRLTINLDPLSDHKIKSILREEAGERFAIEFEQNGTRELRDLLRIPQNLFLTIPMLKDRKPFPKDKRALYETLLAPLFNDWTKNNQPSLEQDLYRKAFLMLSSGKFALEGLVPQQLSGLQTLKMISCDDKQCYFTHDFVKAYLAARFVAPRWQTIYQKEVVDFSWKSMCEFVVLELAAKGAGIKEFVYATLEKDTGLGADLFDWLLKTLPQEVKDWESEFKAKFANRYFSSPAHS